jgi:spindle assembly abnormal protein 6
MLWQVRLSTLTQQVVDKEVLIANLNARVDAAVAEKGTIEESVAILKHSNRTLEDKVTASISEIVKGNQIIERLQSDVRSAKSKLKSKSEASHSMQKDLQVNPTETSGSKEDWLTFQYICPDGCRKNNSLQTDSSTRSQT